MKDKNRLNLDGLASLIHETYPQYKLKDIKAILQQEQEVIYQQLSEGKSVKWGKLLKLDPKLYRPRTVRNNLTNQLVFVPRRFKVKVSKLQKLKKLNIDL